MSVSEEPKSKWGREGGEGPAAYNFLSFLPPTCQTQAWRSPVWAAPWGSAQVPPAHLLSPPILRTTPLVNKSLFQLPRSYIPENKCFSAYQEPPKGVEITDSKPGLLPFFSEAETSDAYLALLSKQCSCLSANSEVTSWKKVASNPGSYFKALAFQTISIGLIK